MASPVDLSAFYHHKEALVVVKNLDALFNVIGKCPFVSLAVICIGKCVGVCQSFADDDSLAVLCSELFSLVLCHDNVVAILFSKVVKILPVAVLTVCLLESAACKVVKIGINKLQTDLIVAVSACLMCIVCGRSCMVKVNAGNDAHLVAHLILKLFSDSFIRCGIGLVHVYCSAVGLVTCGKRSCGGSGIGAE